MKIQLKKRSMNEEQPCGEEDAEGKAWDAYKRDPSEGDPVGGRATIAGLHGIAEVGPRLAKWNRKMEFEKYKDI